MPGPSEQPYPDQRPPQTRAAAPDVRVEIERLSRRLDECMIADADRLRRQLRRIADGSSNKRHGKQRHRHAIDPSASLREIESRIGQSVQLVSRREKIAPEPSYHGLDLPVVARRAEIARAIRAHQVIVLCGETGSGKTTQLPKICLEIGRGRRGLIGHTQPRRIAARTVAARLADELNTSVGKAVGYRIRFTDRTQPDTLIKIMTDGILLAETQSDPRLTQYDTIIIDEAHERSLNIDFLLGYLKRLLPRRPDLKIIITSATIDPHRFSRHFNEAPMIEISGRTFPVEVLYRPIGEDDFESGEEDGAAAASSPAKQQQSTDQVSCIVRAVDELEGMGRGDVLIFLAGERDIRDTAEALRKRLTPETQILPLYARLSAAEQNRIFQPHQGRRIVLATNVAETSLTVPGIRYVIDPGNARISRYSPRTKVQRLPIEAISQASAQQRKGRCGRVGPGVCIRLYSEQDFNTRPEFTEPEILRSNLAGVILQMKALKLGAVEAFPFVEPPTQRMIRDGYQTLHELGAVTDEGDLTETGRQLSRMPIDPRLGKMLLQAQEEHCLMEMLIIAAALSIPDPRERPMDKAPAADEAHREFKDEKSDFTTYLNLWHAFHELRRETSQNKLRQWCRKHFLSWMRMREWQDIHKQLHMLVITEEGMPINTAQADSAAIHRSVLAGLLSNIGFKSQSHEYAGTFGTKFQIFPGSTLFRKSPAWVVAAEVVETTRLYARTVGPVQPEWIERLAPHLVKRTYADPAWDAKSAHVRAGETVTLYGLELVSGRRVHYGPIDAVRSRELFIHHALVLGEYKSRSGFQQHNQALMAQLEAMEAKVRKRNIIIDLQQRYAFFDTRVPAGITNGPDFEKWLKEAEKATPRFLYMTRESLLQEDSPHGSLEAFPDALEMNHLTLPLSYLHEPGRPDDGVTMTIPVEALNQVRAQDTTWLVRGMLIEKIIALIRSLPKSVRICFLPVQEYAQRCADMISPGEVSLESALARALEQLSGVQVTLDMFRGEAMPDHLRMNFKVVDEKGRLLDYGRDLKQLQSKLGAAADERLATIGDDRFSRTGIREWDFGDLPESIEISRRGGGGSLVIRAYPALADDGPESTALRQFDSPEAAREHMRLGLRRLFVLAAQAELTQQYKRLPDLGKMQMQFAVLDTKDELKQSIFDLTAGQAFLADDPVIRTQTQFEDRLEAGWSLLGEAMYAVSTTVGRILQSVHELELRLGHQKRPQSLESAANSVLEQCRSLLGPGFLRQTPFRWLTQYPRYLAAARIRLDKVARIGAARDAELQATITQYETQVRQLLSIPVNEPLPRSAPQAPAVEDLRWHIEELRVSLFAQELGTIRKVSPTRLDVMIAEIRKTCR